jgi:hypothetical protein
MDSPPTEALAEPATARELPAAAKEREESEVAAWS